MPNIDLASPLDDFYARTRQIRLIIIAVESAAKNQAALVTARPNIDFSLVGLQTGNTANAMSLVFLASSFEEFIREEIGQCGNYISERYVYLDESVRNTIRGSYWTACLERFRRNSSILTKSKPVSPDTVALGKVRSLLDTARNFVIDEDATQIDRTIFYQHSNNMRPHVVNEIAARLGIKNLIETAADNQRLRAYFGASTKAEVSQKLRAKLEDFYEKRNQVVHSLSGSTGYGVDVILDYIELFEATADSIKNVLLRHAESW